MKLGNFAGVEFYVDRETKEEWLILRIRATRLMFWFHAFWYSYYRVHTTVGSALWPYPLWTAIQRFLFEHHWQGPSASCTQWFEKVIRVDLPRLQDD